MKHALQLFKVMMVLCIVSCTTLKQSPKYQLGDEFYKFRQKGELAQRVLVFVEGDSVEIFKSITKRDQVKAVPGKDLLFHKSSFDLDIMTIPFKFRLATQNLPEQLNTDFNGNVYLGYRVDRFKVKSVSTPIGKKKYIGHRGLTIGAFGGIGSTSVTPWTTNNAITDEYYGCTLNGGFTFMAAFHNHTAGLGIGWDYLAGRDKDVWIYQNEPWAGVTIGINLN